MGMKTEDHRFERGPAESFFAFQPIHPAPPGAELTVFEDGVSLFDSLYQLPFFL
jgi:hypothetical protein